MEDIFNADETGLFWKALPNKTLAISGEECKGGKLAKERLTVLFCVSFTGEKLKPLVIGKSENPRCLNKIDKKLLPVEWKWNNKAWMREDIFAEWLNNLNEMMIKKKRKIILFIDNASPHANQNLLNVQIKFFPLIVLRLFNHSIKV